MCVCVGVVVVEIIKVYQYNKALSSNEAMTELERLGVPVTKDAYFDAAKADNLGVFVLFHRAGAAHLSY